MEQLVCRCPETGKFVEMTFEIDHDSLLLIWRKPIRFDCPHCGTLHESRVGASYVEDVLAHDRPGDRS